MSCIIIGDSIAHGVADIRKDCKSYTQSGISTLGWSHKWLKKIDFVADSVFISLGSNDQYGNFEDTVDELYKIRREIGEGRNVIWVLPAIKPWIQDIIVEIAYDYGDTVLQMTKLSSDHVHPTMRGYKALANFIK